MSKLSGLSAAQRAARMVLAATLAVALATGGLARAWASTSAGGSLDVVIAGIHVAVCQMDDESGGTPGHSNHDGCDQCALAAAATLAPPLAMPLPGCAHRRPVFIRASERLDVRLPWPARRPRGPPSA